MSEVNPTDLPEVDFRKLVHHEFAQLNAKNEQLHAKYDELNASHTQLNAKYDELNVKSIELNAKSVELHQKLIAAEAAQADTPRRSQHDAGARSPPWGIQLPRMSDFPEFTPTGNEQKDHQSVRKFLISMSAVCMRYSLTDEGQRVQIALERMKGEAARWSAQQLEDFSRWYQQELSPNETEYYAYFEN